MIYLKLIKGLFSNNFVIIVAKITENLLFQSVRLYLGFFPWFDIRSPHAKKPTRWIYYLIYSQIAVRKHVQTFPSVLPT